MSKQYEIELKPRDTSGETLRGSPVAGRASTTVALDAPPPRARTGRKSCARRLLNEYKTNPRVSVVSHSLLRVAHGAMRASRAYPEAIDRFDLSIPVVVLGRSRVSRKPARGGSIDKKYYAPSSTVRSSPPTKIFDPADASAAPDMSLMCLCHRVA